MIILRQKMYLSQELQDWAKKERTRRDWERQERENIRNHYIKNVRTANKMHKKASKGIKVGIAQGKISGDNEEFLKDFKGIKAKNVKFEFNNNKSHNSYFRPNEDYVNKEELMKKAKDAAENFKQTAKSHRTSYRRIKKLENLRNVENKLHGYNLSEWSDDHPYKPIKPENLRSLSVEEKKKYIAQVTKNINSRINTYNTSDSTNKIDDKIQFLKDVEIDPQKENLKRAKNTIEKIKSKDLKTRGTIHVDKNGSYLPAVVRHEDGHALNAEIRENAQKELKSGLGSAYKNGRIKQIPIIQTDERGNKKLLNLNQMLDSGDQLDEYSKYKGGFTNNQSNALVNHNISTEDLKNLYENKKDHLSDEGKTRLGHRVSVIKEEQDASKHALINTYLTSKNPDKDMKNISNYLNHAKNTYEGNTVLGGMPSATAVNLNTNLNISDNKLKVLQKLEDKMIERMRNEGKSNHEIIERVKKFREHHGRMGGFESKPIRSGIFGGVQNNDFTRVVNKITGKIK